MYMKLIALAVAMMSLRLIADSVPTQPDGKPVDLRVDGFIKSKWGQTTTTGYAEGDLCYNYYVEETFGGKVNYYVNESTGNIIPARKPTLYCGCVSTALGMVMKYWRYPVEPVDFGSYTNVYSHYNDEYDCTEDIELECKPKGGMYDWDNMIDDTMSGANDDQCKAIGKLLYDIAITARSTFSPTGTFATVIAAKRALETFGYACECVIFNDSNVLYSVDLLEQIVTPCVDLRSPVVLTVAEAGEVASHAVIVDGYGYDREGNFMIHAVCGNWGSNDDWYYPSEGFRIGDKEFVSIRECLYNILPKESGTIVSGRVLDISGNAVSKATVKLRRDKDLKGEVETDAKGIFAFLTDAGTYSIEASLGKKIAITNELTVVTNASPQIIKGYDDVYDGTQEPVISNLHGIDLRLPGDFEVTVANPVIGGTANFTNSTEVSITCDTTNAVIRYTTDKTDPNKDSKLYTGPFTIHDSITVKAIAYARGMNLSGMAVQGFTNVAECPGDDFDCPLLLQGDEDSRKITNLVCYTRDLEKDPIIRKELKELFKLAEEGYDYNEYHTVWFEWTAPGSGTVSFMTECSDIWHYDVWWYDFENEKFDEPDNCQLQYGAISAVYTGDSCSSLKEIASGGPTGSVVGEYILTDYPDAVTNTFEAVEGQTYRILCACPYNNFEDDWFGYYAVWSDEKGDYEYQYTNPDDAYLQITWNGNLTKAPVEKDDDVSPGKPKEYDTEIEAYAAAVDAKINAPDDVTGDDADAYSGMFDFKTEQVGSKWVNSAILNSVYEQDLQDKVDAAISNFDPLAETLDIDNAVPGFYYSIVYATELGELVSKPSNTDPKLATSKNSKNFELKVPKPDAASRFYRLKVDVR